jgi:DNA-binding PadR family transcriptional regulator
LADILGTFEQAVLLAIVRLGEEAYGRAILKEVTSRLGRDVAAGAVHATLDRLEKKEFLESRLGSGTPVRAGRARRYYHLEPAGIRALNDARSTVDALWHGLAWPLRARRLYLLGAPFIIDQVTRVFSSLFSRVLDPNQEAMR